MVVSRISMSLGRTTSSCAPLPLLRSSSFSLRLERHLQFSTKRIKPKSYTDYLNRLGQMAPHVGKRILNREEATLRRQILMSKDGAGLHSVEISGRVYNSLLLRDACSCDQCVNPSTKQKNFQTSAIPRNIKAKVTLMGTRKGDIQISWENDIPSYGSSHTSVYTSEFFKKFLNGRENLPERYLDQTCALWNSETIGKELQYVTYDDYINTEEGLYRALTLLSRYGLLILRNVPESETSVVSIAERIGNLRDSFYGRTWDVKSVPQAKNVAYTSQYLGLHMDLLYMTQPPGFQFLHCLQNTCSGGSSIFSDSFYAASKLGDEAFAGVGNKVMAFHYHNAGEHYYCEHPLIVTRERVSKGARGGTNVLCINYSPPFQAPFPTLGAISNFTTAKFYDGLKEFTSIVEDPENIYEYRLQEGECVIFNNRRVLHGRKEFDTSEGERWLKGAYIDTDVFQSRFRVLSEKFEHQSKEFLKSHARYIHWDIENPETGRRDSDPMKVWPVSRDLPQAEDYARMI